MLVEGFDTQTNYSYLEIMQVTVIARRGPEIIFIFR